MAVARNIFVGLAVLCLMTAASSAFAAKGMVAPRWSEQDIVDLNADLMAVYRAEFRLRSVTENLTELALNERQRQLLGIEDGVDPLSFHDELREWWKGHILTPSFRIANNPAASCKVAQALIARLLSAERQSQLLGFDTHADVDASNPNSLISKALVAVKPRCLEQAFDACMETGDGWHLIDMLLSAVRVFQLFSIEDQAFEAQAVYLYRRCTVYQLRYHAQTQVAANYTFAWTQDGSVILLSDVDLSGGIAGLAQPHEWRGPRDVDPLDVLQSTTECVTRARRSRMECGAPQPQSRFPARARIGAKDLNLKHFYMEIVVAEDGSVSSQKKSEGNDELTLTFEPPMVVTMATLITQEMSLPLPMVPSKTAVLAAYDRKTVEELELSSWTRVGNDVMFEKSVNGQQTQKKTTYTDNTKYELVHRPDLFPQEEIVAEWELTPTIQPELPNRKPAVPR